MVGCSASSIVTANKNRGNDGIEYRGTNRKGNGNNADYLVGQRGTVSEPVNLSNIMSKIQSSNLSRDLKHKILSEIAMERRKGDIVAYNLIYDDGVLREYKGRTDNPGSVTQVHRKADIHFTQMRRGSTQSDGDWGTSSDKIDEYDYEGGAAQLRSYELEHDEDKSAKVVRTRLDQRSKDQSGCDSFIESDEILKHDYDEDGHQLDDWTPNPANEDDQSGKQSITISTSGLSYTATYNQEGEGQDITVSDESPFEENIAKAEISFHEGPDGMSPERLRAAQGSMAKLNENGHTVNTSAIVTWWNGYYNDRCVYPEEDKTKRKLHNYIWMS